MLGGKIKKAKAKGAFAEIVNVIVVAVFLALIMRTFIYQPFKIPSGSMKPTLLVGDYIFVSKFAYGFSKHSFPLSLNLFNGRIFGSMPRRGDVVVFKRANGDLTDYIKRVVGLPGDKIQMIGGILHINGKPVTKRQVEYFMMEDNYGDTQKIAQFEETLPNNVTHRTLDYGNFLRGDNTKVFEVPAGRLFFMGDNRDDSADSRFESSGVGFVPLENVVGRADVIFFSIAGNLHFWQWWRLPSAIRFGRIFKAIN